MIKIITEQEAKTLLDMWESARNAKADDTELRGEYIVPGCNGFTAIDNSRGECFVEEFPSMCEAMRWLKDKDMPPHVPKDDNNEDGNELSVDGLYFEFCEGFKNKTLRVCGSRSVYEVVRARYEQETGKSSYLWKDGLVFKDTLPRPYVSDPPNYTTEFWQWLQNIIREGIECAIEDMDGMCAFVMGWCVSRVKNMADDKLDKIRKILG